MIKTGQKTGEISPCCSKQVSIIIQEGQAQTDGQLHTHTCQHMRVRLVSWVFRPLSITLMSSCRQSPFVVMSSSFVRLLLLLLLVSLCGPFNVSVIVVSIVVVVVVVMIDAVVVVVVLVVVVIVADVPPVSLVVSVSALQLDDLEDIFIVIVEVQIVETISLHGLKVNLVPQKTSNSTKSSAELRSFL